MPRIPIVVIPPDLVTTGGTTTTPTTSTTTTPIAPGTSLKAAAAASGNYGMQIFNQLGGVSYSSNDVTWNQVDMFFMPANTTTSINYPILRGRQVLLSQVMINPPPIDQRAMAFYLRLVPSTTTVTLFVSNGTVDAYILVMMR